MKLSYVLSTRDRVAQLDFSLFSLANQTLDDYEVIVVDDHSDDDIEALYEKYKDQMNLVYMRLEHDRGWRDCGIGLNFGIREAQGDIIAISHPEVILSKRGLELLYEPHFSMDLPRHYSYHSGIYNPVCVCLPTMSMPPEFSLDKEKYLEVDYREFLSNYLDDATIEMGVHAESTIFICLSLTRDIWYAIGGIEEFESWGSMDPNLLARRRREGCSDISITLPEAITLHQYHEISEKKAQGHDQLEVRHDHILPYLTEAHAQTRQHELVKILK